MQLIEGSADALSSTASPPQAMFFTVALPPLCLLSWPPVLLSTFSSINTIATKLQDRVVVGADDKGRPLTFKHPAVQTVMMFSGELLCLLPFFVRRWWRAAHRAARTQEDKDAAAARQRRATWFFALPALCDACGTTLLNLGLYYTCATLAACCCCFCPSLIPALPLPSLGLSDASVFQMLRGTLVLFAGMLTIVLLRRRLHMQARAVQGGAAAKAAVQLHPLAACHAAACSLRSSHV